MINFKLKFIFFTAVFPFLGIDVKTFSNSKLLEYYIKMNIIIY